MAMKRKERNFYHDQPERLLDWPKWIAGLIQEIPLNERESAKLEVVQEYDGAPHLELTWTHEETAEELAEQERDRLAHEALYAAREFQHYQRLKEKFGPK